MTSRKQKTRSEIRDTPTSSLKNKPLEEGINREKRAEFIKMFNRGEYDGVAKRLVKSPEDMSVIAEILGDGSWEFRRIAAIVLGKASKKGMNITIAIPVLVKALGDEDDGVGDTATWALGKAAKTNHESRVEITRLITEFINSHEFIVEAEKNSDSFINAVKNSHELLKKIKDLEKKAA